ncbi:hypothetical protein RJT34_25249 [Clitoria ternatea]|uniref:Uncharacterized protein n=1 Tax=Clitoria ternatea TaxID=43366 RepID=A0AAN9FPF8_CLITE
MDASPSICPDLFIPRRTHSTASFVPLRPSCCRRALWRAVVVELSIVRRRRAPSPASRPHGEPLRHLYQFCLGGTFVLGQLKPSLGIVAEFWKQNHN